MFGVIPILIPDLSHQQANGLLTPGTKHEPPQPPTPTYLAPPTPPTHQPRHPHPPTHHPPTPPTPPTPPPPTHPTLTHRGTNYVLAGFVALGAQGQSDWTALDQAQIFPQPVARRERSSLEPEVHVQVWPYMKRSLYRCIYIYAYRSVFCDNTGSCFFGKVVSKEGRHQPVQGRPMRQTPLFSRLSRQFLDFILFGYDNVIWSRTRSEFLGLEI